MTLGIGIWLAVLVIAPEWAVRVGSLICHQRPERSFFVNGHQLVVCARCLGLYAGGAAAAPLALLRARPIDSAQARKLALAAAAPTAITWTLEAAGLAHVSNVLRFAAALPLGFIASWLVLGVLAAADPRDAGISAR